MKTWDLIIRIIIAIALSIVFYYWIMYTTF